MLGILAELEAELRERRRADRHRAFLRVRVGKRRESAQPAGVAVARNRVALVSEQPVEPARAQRVPGGSGRRGGVLDDGEQLAERDLLLLLGTSDQVGLARGGRVGGVAPGDEAPALVVQRRGDGERSCAELLALPVLVEHGESCLRGAQRQLVAAPFDACREEHVLERVLRVHELLDDEPRLAGLAQPVEPFAVVSAAAPSSAARSSSSCGRVKRSA